MILNQLFARAPDKASTASTETSKSWKRCGIFSRLTAIVNCGRKSSGAKTLPRYKSSAPTKVSLKLLTQPYFAETTNPVLLARQSEIVRKANSPTASTSSLVFWQGSKQGNSEPLMRSTSLPAKLTAENLAFRKMEKATSEPALGKPPARTTSAMDLRDLCILLDKRTGLEESAMVGSQHLGEDVVRDVINGYMSEHDTNKLNIIGTIRPDFKEICDAYVKTHTYITQSSSFSAIQLSTISHAYLRSENPIVREAALTAVFQELDRLKG